MFSGTVVDIIQNISSVPVFYHKLTFFFVIKHLYTVAIHFVVGGATAKLTYISFFLLHNHTERRFVLTIDLSSLGI